MNRKLAQERARHAQKQAAKKQKKARKSNVPLWKQRAEERQAGMTGNHADRRKKNDSTTP